MHGPCSPPGRRSCKCMNRRVNNSVNGSRRKEAQHISSCYLYSGSPSPSRNQSTMNTASSRSSGVMSQGSSACLASTPCTEVIGTGGRVDKNNGMTQQLSGVFEWILLFRKSIGGTNSTTNCRSGCHHRGCGIGVS